MTIVRSTIATEPGTPVIARLQAVDNWTIDHAEWVSPITTTSDSSGAWQMDLPPQNHFKSASTCWRIEHRYGTRLVVVPEAGPVYVDDIEVHSVIVPGDPNAQPIYVLRSEIGRPSGVAGLGADGKVPADQLPASSGGSVPDATTTSKGVVQLAGDLSGTAGAPTVVGLAAKYVKPGGGIPKSDLTLAVGTSLDKADASASLAYVDGELGGIDATLADLQANKADAAATSTALAGKASKLRVTAAYVDTGTPSGDVPPNTSGAWTKYAGVGELVIPAAVGDYVTMDLAVVTVAAATSVWDIGIMVGTSIVWTSSSGTATPAPDGDPGLAPFSPPVRPFMSAAGWLVVGAPHIDSGNVRFVLMSKSDGGGKIFHATTNPFRWRAHNHGLIV